TVSHGLSTPPSSSVSVDSTGTADGIASDGSASRTASTGAVTVCIRQGYVLPAARPRRRAGHVTSPQGPGVPGEPSSPHRTSTALLTDKYELTMIQAALADGTADRPCVFEVFARRLPSGRRYGVVGGTG